MRRPDDESRPEIPVMILRSHSRGGRSSACAKEPLSQAGSSPIRNESLGTIPLDRISPDRNRKYTPTTPLLPRWVRLSILHRWKPTTLVPPIDKFSLVKHSLVHPHQSPPPAPNYQNLSLVTSPPQQQQPQAFILLITNRKFMSLIQILRSEFKPEV